MADIRDLLLKEQMGGALLRVPKWAAWASRLKLAIRRTVVATSVWPLTPIYALIYRMHVRYAVRVLRQFPGTRSVYAAGGIASGAIVYGISDIDLVTIGDWSDDQQMQVIQALRRLSWLSPLYDPALSHNAHSLATLGNLYATDFYFQYRFDQGRNTWKLLYGEDSLSKLPSGDSTRAAGGQLMAMRLWWGSFAASAFGGGPTSKDELFRNSIAFKTTAEMVGLAGGREPCPSRRATIERACLAESGETRAFLKRLLASERRHYRRFDGDVQEEVFRFLLPLMEKTHAASAGSPIFQAAAAGRVTVDADPREIPGTPATRKYASGLVADVKREWLGFRSAFLVPGISFFNLDDSMLLLEVDPAKLPGVHQLRELCRRHAAVQAGMRQRVALSVLLRRGAYQLETVTMLELWHLVVTPEANPDIFELLSRKEFVIDGSPRPADPAPGWTCFANALVEEELRARRAAMAGQTSAGSLPNLELIRNLWRHLQLEMIQRTAATGTTVIPMSPPAIQRAMRGLGIPAAPVFDRLREAYQEEVDGQQSRVQELLPELMAFFMAFR